MPKKLPHQILFHHIHKRGLDKIGYVMIALGVFTVLPQIHQLFTTQSAGDISMLSWLAYTGSGFFWLWFAIERKIKVLVYSAIVGLGVKAVMIYGIYLYGDISLTLFY